MSQSQPRLKLGLAVWKLFLAATDMYAVLILVYLVLRALFGDRFWLVALISTALHWLLLPSFVLLPLAIRRRYWLVVAMLGACVIAFAWLFGPLFMPQAAAPADTPAFTVMTANVGVAHHVSTDKLVTVLRDSGADIVALQELSDVQQAAIERDLRDVYPYQVLHGYHRSIIGEGLLSRYPILEADEPFHLNANVNLHLRAVIDVDGTLVTVVTAHPPPLGLWNGVFGPHPFAAAEIATLAEMATANGPGLLLGDINTTDQNNDYALLPAAGLTDAFRAVGWGFGATCPVHINGTPLLPLVRLDYIWYTPHFRAVEAWVGPRTGADHLPVLARLAWR